MMQAHIILATLLARFDFAPAGRSPRPVMHMTIRPEPGVKLTATPAETSPDAH
jgi:cytochrome P450